MIHVIDVVLDSFSNLFPSHSYSPLEKLYSVILFMANISLTYKLMVSVGAYIHGFKTLEQIGPGYGCEDVEFLLKIGRFDKQNLAYIPHLHVRPIKIIYSPLSKMKDELDVVLLFTIPSQAQLF
jgi:hypothetical protein